MFNDMAMEHPIPSWKVLEWIVEDYGMFVRVYVLCLSL